MSDWDASDNEAAAAPAKAAPAPVKPSKWADEDAEDDVKDDWDASEDEKPAAPAVPKGPIRQKGITKQKIAEKEAAEAAEAERQAKEAAEAADPTARRRAARERELKADLDNASSLFGSDAVASMSISDNPLEANPRTADEFSKVAQQLSEIIVNKWGNKPLFARFVEEHTRALAAPLKDLDVRKCSSALSAIANEKQRAARDAGKKKNPKAASKPMLAGSRQAASRDVEAYDEALDDDQELDFM